MSNDDIINQALNQDFGGLLSPEQEDYSYVNKNGVDLLTDASAVKDVRDYYAAQGTTFNNYSEMWDKFYSDRRWNDVNTLGAGSALIESSMAGDDRDRLARLSRIWSNAPMRGSTLDRVWEYGKAAILDPTNLIPVGGLAAKAKAGYGVARAAGKTIEQSRKAGRVAGAKAAGTQEALIGGAVGGGIDAAQQVTEIQQGLSDEFDVGRFAGSAALDSALSGVAGGALEMAGTSNIGRSVPVLNKLIGGDYADDLGAWTKETTLGQNMTQRATALARSRDSLEAQISDDTIPVNEADIQEQIAEIDQELMDIDADREFVDNINGRMDELAKQMQDGQKNGTDTRALQREYSQLTKQFQTTTKKKRLPARERVYTDDQERAAVGFASGRTDGGDFTSTRGEQPDVEPSPVNEAGEIGFPNQRKIDEDSVGFSTNREQGEFKSVREPIVETEDAPVFSSSRGQTEAEVQVDGDTVEQAIDEAAGVQPETPKIAAETAKVTRGQADAYAKLLEANKDIITVEEINELVRDGKISVTKQGIGAGGIKQLNALIKERRSVPDVIAETAAEVADDTAKQAGDQAQEQMESAVEEQVAGSEFAPSDTPDLEDEADVIVQSMLQDVSGLEGNRIVNINTKAKPNYPLTTPVGKIVRQRLARLEMLDAQRMADAMHEGDMLPNDPLFKQRKKELRKELKKGKITQKQFNIINKVLNKSLGRQADRTQASMDRLADVPPYIVDDVTGRMRKNPQFAEAGQGASFAMQGGVDIGGGRSVTSLWGARPRDFPLSTAKLMVESDAKAGVGKSVYPYTGYKGERLYTGQAETGDIVFYSPVARKSFKTYEEAAEASGVPVDQEFLPYDEDMVPIFSDKEYAAEKSQLLENRKNKILTNDQYKAALEKLDIRATNAMDTAQKKEVIGRSGKIIKRLKAGIPNTKNGKVIALIPRKQFTDNGELVMARVLTERQQKAGLSADALLSAEDANDWFVGYVPKTMRTSKSDIDAMIEGFDPLDETNKVGDIDRVDPSAPRAPLDLQSRGDTLIVDTRSLKSDELNSLFYAYSLANNKNMNMIGKIAKPDDIHEHEVTIRDLTRLEAMIDNADWDIDYNINGKIVPMSNKIRLKMLDTLHGLAADMVPQGIRRPATDINASLEQLNGIYASASVETRNNMERLIRLVVPDKVAPIFEVAEMDANVLGRYVNDRNDALNRIQINADQIGKTKDTVGLSDTHIVAHELGHWVYNNLLPNSDKSEFWRAINGYYDGEGRLYNDGDRDAMMEIQLRSPYIKGSKKSVGFDNALDSPAEYFANQFALFMNHKYDLMMWPNESFFSKTMKLAKKLWFHLSRKHIVDPDLEPIFNKLIMRKDLAQRQQYLNVKEPTNKYSKILFANYEGFRAIKSDLEGALATADIEAFVNALKLPETGLESQFRRLTTTEENAKKYARSKGENYKEHKGMLNAVAQNGAGFKMKAIVQRLENLGVRGSSEHDELKGTVGTSFDLGDYQEMHSMYERDIIPVIDQVMRQINDAYYQVQHGDIPTLALDAMEIENRLKFKDSIAKKAQLDANTASTRRKRGQRKNFVAQAVSRLKEKKTPENEADFSGFAAENYPDIEPLVRKFAEEAKKGKNFSKAANAIAREIGDKLYKQMPTIEPATVVRTTKAGPEGPYQNAKAPELAIMLREALIGTGDKVKLQDVAFEFTRRKNKPKAVVPDSQAVIDAVKVEAAFDRGGETSNGIGASTPFVLSDFLENITARTPEKERAARKIAQRVIALGHVITPVTNSEQFKSFRTMSRQLSANLSTADITQTVKQLSRVLFQTSIISDGTRNLLERTAVRMGADADSVLEQLIIEDVDMTATRSLMQQIKEQLGDVEGFEVEEAINEARDNVRDGIAYTLNGLISNPQARERFLPLSLYGDMKSGENLTPKGSPTNIYSSDRVPAEFAVDFGSDISARMSETSRQAVRDFTGGDTEVQFIVPNRADPLLGNAPEITVRPTNTLRNMRQEIIESAPEANQSTVADLIDQAQTMREGVNNMRTNGSQTDLMDHYTFEEVATEKISGFGATDLTYAKPVFVRDIKPAIFPHQMNYKSDIVKGITDIMKREARTPDRRTQIERTIEDNRGLFKGREVFQTLARLAGSAEELRRIIRRGGYTTLSMDGNKVLVSQSFARPIDSPTFVTAKPVLGEKDVVSGVNSYIMSEATIAKDGGEQAVKMVSGKLEEAGVSKDALTAVNKVRTRSKISMKDAEAVRVATHATTRTQSEIIRRSGMETVAEFAEPKDGSGGHYERVHAKMARVMAPITKSLSLLPDSKNPLGRWFDAGLRQMYDTTAEGFGKLAGERGEQFGFNPTRREQQPKSHSRIVTALRFGETNVDKMLPEERKIYDTIRGYLDTARGRMAAAGEFVGNIKSNYFPQVWRTDLIQARRPEFEQMLGRYFLAEDARNNGLNTRLSKEQALDKAKGVTRTLIEDNDGVTLPKPKVFSGSHKEDHLDYQRMIRLDQFKEFVDPRNPNDNLAQFLENDLMAVMSKYTENLERRLDITERFGPNAHALTDYFTTIRGGPDAVMRLLSSPKVIKSDYKVFASGNDTDLEGYSVLKDSFDNSVFKAPFKSVQNAEFFSNQLIMKARSGANREDLVRDIMERLDGNGETDEFSDEMRKNFSKRADAIAGALYDTKGFQVMPSDDNVRHAETFGDLLMHKPQGTKFQRAISAPLRMINGVTLLSFTTLTSLGDLVLPLIRSGDFKAWSSALGNYMADPVAGSAYRDMIRNVGVAVENTVHQRMANSYGVDANRFTTGFFTATGLTPWTDMMREISGATAYEHFKASARIALESPNTRQGRLAKRALDEFGLQELYQKGASDIDMIMRSAGTEAENPMYEKIQTGIIKFANESIFAPNKNDQPQWATHPVGQLIFQLKSFPLKMLRLGRYAVGEATRSEDRNLAPLLLYMTAGPAMGFTAANVKDVVQGRGGEDNREFEVRDRKLSKSFTSLEGMLGDNADKALGWYWDGFMTMGGLGIIGELMYDTANQLDNGAYGQLRMVETFAGPTSGLVFDASTVLAGLQSAAGDAISGEGTNGKERAAMREVISRVPIIGQTSAVRENIVDYTMGPKGG